MQCLHCQYENLPDAVFCEGCGTKLARSCPQCQTDNRLSSKFCRKCGTTLTPPTPAMDQISAETPVVPRAAGSGAMEAERRQLTVMFCDLVGSTPLAERLDPEDYREVVRAYQQTCVEVIERFDGYIARYMGDALLVYFGYPQAHEDDALRAVRAGLGLLAALPALNAQLHRTLSMLRDWPLQIRVGLHTGFVLLEEIGAGASREHMAVGETPNLAARLQGIAEPDTVVLSPVTARLVEGYVVTENLGARALKGVALPVQVYRCLRETTAQDRLDVAVTKGLTPLVGREQEIGLLHERWERVKDGAGQVVMLRGEAGIGKSRLVHMLKEHIGREAHVRIEWRCSPYYQQSALYPVVEHLQRLFQWSRDDFPQEKLRKLEAAIKPYGFPLAEVVPLLASLLSLSLPDHYAPLAMTPQRQKQKTLEVLLTWLLKETEQQPVRFIMEDLHWVDPSSMELLSLLVDQAPTVRILILLTFRPDFLPPWASRSHVTQIALSRLPRRQVQTMVERITGGKALPVEVLRQLVDKTDGVPLFVEELTKMVLESGLVREQNGHYELTGALPSLAIPSTLQDSLMARLDRLGAAKEVVQLGATLGKEFPYEWLRAVSPLDETSLQQELAQLVDAEFLYQRGLPPRASYFFKHALIQDAAYQSLLRRTRQQYHRQIAQVLVEQFPEIQETQPELVAHHYTEAGLKNEAIGYWQKAGQRAIERSANAEAIHHLRKGLALLETLPDTSERAQHELPLQITLGNALIAAKGYAAQEVEQAYGRARELSQQVGETRRLFSVLSGLFGFYLLRGELQTAREIGEQFFALAQREHNIPRLLWAHWALGVTLFHLGEFVPAREHLEQGIALYNPQEHRSRAFLYGQDTGVACLSYASWLLGLLGYPDQGLQRIREALALAQELSHPFSLAFALTIVALAHQLRWDTLAAQELAEAAIALATEQEFPHWLTISSILQGWTLAEQGQGEKGIAQMRQGLTAHQAMGAELARPWFLALLAEAYGNVGRAEEGLIVLAEALAIAHKNTERFCEAELYRLKGELLLALAEENQVEAESFFRQAIDLARRQHAKSWELRAAMSLGRLWLRQGKKEKARQLLVETYGWFIEGFDTAALKAAKTFLAELI
jgi:TOMM system kinase/cyclase fusion protein